MFADQSLGHVHGVVLQPSPARTVDQGQFIFMMVNSVEVLRVFTVLIERL